MSEKTALKMVIVVTISYLIFLVVFLVILGVRLEKDGGERLSGYRFDSYCGNYVLQFLRSNEFRLESHETFVMGTYKAPYRNNRRVFMSIPHEFGSMPTNFIVVRDVMDLRIGSHLLFRRR